MMNKAGVVTTFKKQFAPLMTSEQLAAAWPHYLTTLLLGGRITKHQHDTWLNPFETKTKKKKGE